MRNEEITLKDAFRKFGKRNLIAALLCMLFFVVLIVTYFTFLYSSEKNNIVTRGQLSAVNSMKKFNHYIETGENIIRQTKYKLDKMLENGDSVDSIKKMLVEDTDCIRNAIDDKFTGLYGYIDGEYCDGAQWVPDDDYIATERPWYIEAVDNNGKMTTIEPYVDAQTGLMAVTVAQTLCDGVSVVAIDITFDMVKIINEEIGEDSNVIGIIMDTKGNILAHSDEKEIGHNYLTDKDSLGAFAADEFFSTGEKCFEVSYFGKDYVVYIVKINDKWYSMSLVDSGESYKPIQVMIIVTILVILITIVILGFLFYKIIIRNMISDRLNVQLSTTADIYLAVYDIDIINDTYTAIRRNELVERVIQESDLTGNAQESIYKVMSSLPAEEFRDELYTFMSFKTLDERMGDNRTITMEFQKNDGLWRRARYIVSQRTDGGELSHVLWMVEDIDAEKRMRDELRDMSARAVAANEAKSLFLSNMSHEIRTPINAVLGMNEMILRESDDDHILTYADSIQTAGSLLLGIINEILDLSKIEAGRMEIVPVEYELSSVLNDLVNMIQPRMDDKELIFNIEFDKTVPNRLKGDEIRVRQIISNILTNAAKYTPSGTVTFSLSYDKLEEEPDCIMLNVSVRDTGIGIKEEDISRIFVEYTRFDEERNRNVEGTGLGMPITQKLLNMMGSTLEVESEYGKGSEFSFSLKQQVIKWDAIGDYEASYRRNRTKRKRYKAKFTAPEADILVIDDTRMNLLVFKSLLKQTGVHIDRANSGDEGIALALEKKYDIIFLDHMMPHKDGVQTLQEFRGMTGHPNEDTPVICLTANAVSGAREKYLKAGFDDYLTKPIDSAKLENMMLEYLPKDKIKGAVQ